MGSWRIFDYSPKWIAKWTNLSRSDSGQYRNRPLDQQLYDHIRYDHWLSTSWFSGYVESLWLFHSHRQKHAKFHEMSFDWFGSRIPWLHLMARYLQCLSHKQSCYGLEGKLHKRKRRKADEKITPLHSQYHHDDRQSTWSWGINCWTNFHSYQNNIPGV